MSALQASFWKALPLGRGVELAAHDANGLAAFSKPAGLMSHPNRPAEQPRSLLTVPYHIEGEYFEWNEDGGTARRLWLLNRLDAATSGIILVSADADMAAAIREQFKRKLVRKIYLALVFGGPSEPRQVWRDRLSVQRRSAQVRTGPGNIPAECVVTIERSGRGDPKLSLIRLEPRTGRSHQLRVQCAKRGMPIVGDQTYGDFRRNREFAKRCGNKRLFLHSLETSFDYEYRGKRFHFEARAEAPPDFRQLA